MFRLLTNPRFWVLAFVLAWMTVVTVLIAVNPTLAAPDATPPR
jgi:hypothetical protein